MSGVAALSSIHLLRALVVPCAAVSMASKAEPFCRAGSAPGGIPSPVTEEEG